MLHVVLDYTQGAVIWPYDRRYLQRGSCELDCEECVGAHHMEKKMAVVHRRQVIQSPREIV